MTSNQIKYKQAKMENERDLYKVWADYGLLVDPDTNKILDFNPDVGVKTRQVAATERATKAKALADKAAARFGSDPISGLVKTMLGWTL